MTPPRSEPDPERTADDPGSDQPDMDGDIREAFDAVLRGADQDRLEALLEEARAQAEAGDDDKAQSA